MSKSIIFEKLTGLFLFKKRKQAGKKLLELAKETNIDSGLISKFENNIRQPSQSQVETLAEKLNFSGKELLYCCIHDRLVDMISENPEQTKVVLRDFVKKHEL